MPMHRRRVYVERGPGRKAQIEGWLSFSIFLSVVILLLSLFGCLPDVLSSAARWLLPGKLSDRFGLFSETESSVLVLPCEILMTLSGAYLVVALFIKSHTR